MPLPYLDQIWRYPVKSAQGILETGAVLVGPYGLEHDHCFGVFRTANNIFCSQRELPKMALLGTALHEGILEIQVPGWAHPIEVSLTDFDGPRVSVSVHKDTNILAIHQGPVPARVLSEFLGEQVFLARIAPESNRLSKEGQPIAFHDGRPIMGLSLSGLEIANTWFPEPVDVRRFRPQLVFAGCPPFAEDEWLRFWIGHTLLDGRTHCYRCRIPDVDPDTGTLSKGIFAALSKYRGKWNEEAGERRAYLGRNMSIAQGMILASGERVFVVQKDEGLTFDPPGFRPPKTLPA